MRAAAYKYFCLLIFPGIVVLSLFLLTTCQNSGEKSNNTSLPNAIGETGEIILVMDSSLWQDNLGKELREVFMSPIPALPQSEPRFQLKYANPYKITRLLRRAQNLIYVTVLSNESRTGRKMRNFFTEESLNKIQKNPQLFMFSKSNEYARGQEVMHLFGATPEALIANLKQNTEKLREHFHQLEIQRIQNKIFSSQKKSISQNLLQKYGFYMRIPSDYEMVPMEEPDEHFVWLRRLGQELDKSFFVAFKDYNSESLFSKDSILDWRQKIVREHVSDSEEVYMTVQPEFPAHIDTVNLNNKFAIETRALWKLSNNTMGGPFISYTFVDTEQNRLYYIEGFVYSPSRDKRSYILEMEAILKTFRTATEYQDKPIS